MSSEQLSQVSSLSQSPHSLHGRFTSSAPDRAGVRGRWANRLSHGAGYWVVALALLTNMAFSAVPTPLYVIYQQRDHFSNIGGTVVYAVYAVGVIASLFLAGHVSDWMGRRRLLVFGLLVNVLSAFVFIAAPSFTGLIIARIISGFAVGVTTATATAWMAELHAAAHPGANTRRAQMVAIAANLGGIGVGPLVAGILAAFVPAPLVVPYVVVGGALVILTLLVAAAPETASGINKGTKWRPQRIAVPAHARAQFFAATGAGFASFAVYGVFNSLVPNFLVGTLHESSHFIAGAVAFAAFAAGALAQMALSRLSIPSMLRVSVPVLFAGLTLFTLGMWMPSLAIFVIGGVVTGAGAGLVFRGAMVAAGNASPIETRGETLAGFFLGAYVGLSVPVIGLGIATTYASTKDVMLVFVVAVAVMIVATVRSVVGHVVRADAAIAKAAFETNNVGDLN
jgi:predicted MFS family arabinose efflux permease